MARFNIKTYMVFFLLLLIAAGIYGQGHKAILVGQLCLTVFSAVAFDLAISFFKSRRFIFPTSAVISGLIVGMVMFPGQNIWYYILATFFAVISKYVLRFNKKHIFNPANFGLLLVNIFWGAVLSWWTVNIWFIIIPGIFIAFKIRRLHLVISYLLVTAALAIGWAYFKQGELFDYFPFINLYFVFVMLIEPKTSPVKICRGLVFGSLVGFAGFIIYLIQPRFDYLVSSLALGNLLSIFMERIKKC